jgi:hypothetical protein
MKSLPDIEEIESSFTVINPVNVFHLHKVRLDLMGKAVDKITVAYLVDFTVEDEQMGPQRLFFTRNEAESSELLSSEDLKATELAFDETPFLNPDFVSEFVNTISSCSSEWRSAKTTYYAPYIALINASMIGKSRLTSQLPQKGVFCTTICLRKSADLSYRPPRTHFVADWAATPGVDEARFIWQTCQLFEYMVQDFKQFLTIKQTIQLTYSLKALAIEWEKKSSDRNFWIHLKSRTGASSTLTQVAKIVADSQAELTK